MSTDPHTPRTTNRLGAEASPYLLQHAHNPVDWWPWSPEALSEAKRRDVPILLSIGYSACHWCHVMERESFDDSEIARLMNERFVCIKVDREERPDLDLIYQRVVQLLGRSGGWPLTVFLTPEQRPFFGGTYFPPVPRYGMPSFPQLLAAVSEAYRDRRADVEGQAGELTRAVASIDDEAARENAPTALGPDLLERTARALERRFDDVYGGFGNRPKFPNTMPLEVLLRRGALDGEGRARDAVRLALESMRRGGIFDQLGGGFHRYSTDERWLVPHFEKMLYDNALLLRAYVDAYGVFRDPLFASTAREIAAYVTREMTDPEGGYYASQDADSEGEEGKFFVWTPNEVQRVLAGDDTAIRVALAAFGVTEEGNFEEHGPHAAAGANVLHEAKPLRAVAAQLDLSEAEAEAALTRAKRAMFEAREHRPKPFRDEKILTSWNALMIGAMAEAGAALGEPTLTQSAERALAFVEAKLVRRGESLEIERLAKAVPDATGARTWVVRGPGFLDDYAYLANAALDLYEVTGNPGHVVLAREVADAMLATFWEADAGFHFTRASSDGDALIVRMREAFDNAVPSGASMACRSLLRLGTLTARRYGEIGERELARLAPAAIAQPFGFGQTICELDRLVRGSVDVVLVGPRTDVRTQALAREVFARWLPNRTLAWLDPLDAASREACAAIAEGKPASDAPVAYACHGRTCSLPVREPRELAELLGATPTLPAGASIAVG